MNFTIFTNTRFKIGVDVFSRLYYVVLKSNNKIKLVNALDSSILKNNINPDEILIDGEKMKNISQLEAVVFNKQCGCDKDKDDAEMRIFDETFDETFE